MTNPMPDSGPATEVEPPRDEASDAEWRAVLTGSDASAYLRRARRLFGRLPSEPRCKLCWAPFGAPLGPIFGAVGYGRWAKNPQLCSPCMKHMIKHHGGAELELSLLFADLRGSTGLAERMAPAAYSRLLDRFYGAAYGAIRKPGGIVDKYLGDGIFALFIPGFTGPAHAAAAIEAARGIQRGVMAQELVTADGAPLPVGIGVHTGPAYVGVIGRREDLLDFSAQGDAVNVAQRLSAAAAAGEILFSEETRAAAGLAVDGLEARTPELKGVSREVRAWAERVLPVEAA